MPLEPKESRLHLGQLHLIFDMRKFLSFLAGTLIAVSCTSPVVDLFGNVYGIITDANTGDPVRAASVIISPGNITTVTGSDGHYEFVDLEEGQYKLQVTAPGYLVNTRQVTALAGTNVSCDIVLIPEQKIPGLQLSTYNLNFSSTHQELMLTLTNSGTTGDLVWSVSGLNVPWLAVTPDNGRIPSGGSESVKVSIDRENMSDSDYGVTYFSIDANGNSSILTVSVEKAENEEQPDNGNGEEPTSKNPTAGLYAYFTFEDNCDNTVEGAADGTAINSPEFTEGMQGTKALKLISSANSYMTVPEPMIDEETYTVSFWVKGLGDGHIFHVDGSHSEYCISDRLTCKNGTLHYCQMTSGEPVFSHPALDSEQFTHIAITQNNQTARLYINGKFTDLTSHNYGAKNYSIGKGIKFILGGELISRLYRDPLMDGASMIIDNLRIYKKRELSAEEIGQIYEFEK